MSQYCQLIPYQLTRGKKKTVPLIFQIKLSPAIMSVALMSSFIVHCNHPHNQSEFLSVWHINVRQISFYWQKKRISCFIQSQTLRWIIFNPDYVDRLCFQIVLENSSREDKHECPFGRSSIELTKMLCEILKVGELRKCTLHFFCPSEPYHSLTTFLGTPVQPKAVQNHGSAMKTNHQKQLDIINMS